MPAPTLDPSSADALCALGIVRTYPRHTILVQEGDRSDQLFVVISGRLEVYLADADSREIVIDTLGPRQYFGEMALDGQPRSASVKTTETSKLAVVQAEDFKRFLRDHPDAAFQLIGALIQRARNLTRTVGSLALLDVYGRVARLLLDHATEESGQLVVSEHMTHQEIANRVGASRETVSRILTDMREGRFLTLEDGRIVVAGRPHGR